jgi:hypothetical protein
MHQNRIGSVRQYKRNLRTTTEILGLLGNDYEIHPHTRDRLISYMVCTSTRMIGIAS